METHSHQTPKDKKDDANREKMEKRVKSLFAEQEPPSYASIREVDAMKARISELEAKLAQQEMKQEEQPNASEKLEETASTEQPVSGSFTFRSALTKLGAAIIKTTQQVGRPRIRTLLIALISIATISLFIGIIINSGLATLLLDVSNLTTQPSLPGIFILLLTLAVVGILGYFTIRQFRDYPLRARLTTSFLLLTIAPLAILGWQTYTTTYDILEEQIKAEILRSSMSTGSEFQDFLDTQFNTIRSQSRSAEIVEYMGLSPNQRNGSEQETLALDKLKSFGKNKPAYIKSYALLDDSGVDVLDTNQSKIGTNFAEHEFFKFVKTEKTVYVSGLTMSSTSDRNIYFAAPITSKSGELLGVYVIAVNPDIIQTTIEAMIRNGRLAQPSTEFTYIIDGDNYFLLAHSLRKDLVFKTYLDADDARLVKLQEQGVDPDRLSRLVVPQPEVVAGLSTIDSTIDFQAPSYDDVLTQSAAIRLPDSNWIVVTSRDIGTISTIIQSQTRTNVTTSVIIIAFVSLFALIASYFFTSPIIQLTRVAENISAGDFAQKADVRRNDEIGVLSRTFNTMTGQIQALISGLEKRVEDRTHDLELATEVGYAVSQRTGDLSELLSQSVDLIRSRYGLYYTQIYLLDPSKDNLVLHAATGDIGKQLLTRGHRLSLSADSLNSRAASSQKPVLVRDTQQSDIFLPNPLLPLTRSELAVPMIVGNKVVGVFDMQSDKPETFSEANLSAFQVLAGQLAIAIQNSTLFDQMNEARVMVEEQARRLTSSGWQEFLNAVERSETIGYTFDQKNILSLAETQNTNLDNALSLPIEVSGAQIGEVQLADEATRTWSVSETEIIQTVISRVAQHIENLRLLAQAERYRHEAEQVSRRLTSEGWSEYFRTRKEVADGFSYSQDRVLPLNGNGQLPPSESALTYPLTVRDEPIGAMVVDSQNGAESHATELIAAVAEQLSDHIENLRLLEQAEQRRLELETVATVSSTVSTVLDPDKLLQTVVDMTKERFSLYHAHIYLADDDWQTLLLAAGAGEIGREMVAQQHTIPMNTEQSLVARASRERKTVITNDVRSNPDFLPNPLLPDTRAEMAVPMIVGNNVLGVFDVQSDKPNGFSDEDADIYKTLASQVAVALQNARLYVEQAATVTQLRELDRLKSAFLANMSHELRTPLNSILGFTDVMLEGLDGELTDYMDNDLRLIQKNGRHLLHLINDVLDMAKIESGRMNLHPETFKVHDIFEEVTSITAPLASEKNLSLFIAENSDPKIEIYADNTRLRQVMINLVNNSIKFTEKGRITLSVKSIDDARVLIAVKDTGIGIPPDHLESVFLEFSQVDTTTTRKAGGTGLGLPISRRLIEMHGGRLWAESSGVDGEGSTFFVELPIEAHISDVIEKQEK